jgi:hypothetical protein
METIDPPNTFHQTNRQELAQQKFLSHHVDGYRVEWVCGLILVIAIYIGL